MSEARVRSNRSKAGQALRVLVADDVEAVRYTILLEMRDLGWAVEEASSGEETMRKLDSGSYDVLVTDIWMPKGDGIAVIKAIRRKQPNLRIFAISGGGPGMSLASAAALAEVWGAEKLLVKPFDVAELIEAIQG
jgi:two-component system chemotaxis response regulator CheY